MVRQELVKYLEDAFLFQFDDEITESTDLFKAGIVDSYGYIQLMKFIQDRFEISISKRELLSSVVTTLSGMVMMVEAKLTSGSALLN